MSGESAALIVAIWSVFRCLFSIGCTVAFVYQSIWVGDYGYGAFWGVCSLMWMPKGISS